MLAQTTKRLPMCYQHRVCCPCIKQLPMCAANSIRKLNMSTTQSHKQSLINFLGGNLYCFKSKFGVTQISLSNFKHCHQDFRPIFNYKADSIHTSSVHNYKTNRPFIFSNNSKKYTTQIEEGVQDKDELDLMDQKPRTLELSLDLIPNFKQIAHIHYQKTRRKNISLVLTKFVGGEY